MPALANANEHAEDQTPGEIHPTNKGFIRANQVQLSEYGLLCPESNDASLKILISDDPWCTSLNSCQIGEALIEDSAQMTAPRS